MLENLRLAVKRQKRLIIIFLLTIFVPSISLSIFGIRAIRNERFRMAKQIENEHRRAAENLKLGIDSQFKELGSILQNLAHSSAFMQRDDAGIKNLLDAQLAGNPLVELVFIAFEGEDPFFPLFQPRSSGSLFSTGLKSEGVLQERLRRAEAYEFKERNYKSAVSLYRNLFDQSPDTNVKARMLANISRCLVKAEDYEGAIQNYQRICEDYPESFTSSGLPLVLISQLQMASCYLKLGELQTSLQTSLDLYRDILHMRWPLSETQFKTYAALAEDAISDILSENQLILSRDDYKKEFDRLKSLHQERLEQWMVVEDIRREIVPELRGRRDPSQYQLDPFRFHKTLNGRDFLLSVVQIPDPSQSHSVGLLGIKIEERHLIENVIPSAIANIQFIDSPDVVISNLSGEILLGERNSSAETPTTTAFFEDNFPPWRIEIFQSGGEALGTLDLKRNFYFWTILTLVVVLISGALLISRTIAQEMAVLRLKSDFVSSVSHEFKSPLTSIKALAERLRDGKVKDSERMKQYFSVITQDADRLTHLVRNILDFSKIEEGKKEYEFEETDIARLVTQKIEDFRREEIAKEMSIQTRISEDIPHLDVDKEALSQALNNLLDNAVKFSAGRKKIEVILKKENANVIIEVKDKGIGIPADDLNKIFDKFYQGHKSVRQTAKGTGLGLTLVKHTIEAHGGRVEVKSRAGEGSTFSVILPIRKKRE
jgi:signal transduction histidine kinase/tetratricopeptide (TPR) repeat protein